MQSVISGAFVNNPDTVAAKADGTVTKAERVKLNREASRNSKVIHAQKHDRHTAAPAAAK